VAAEDQAAAAAIDPEFPGAGAEELDLARLAGPGTPLYAAAAFPALAQRHPQRRRADQGVDRGAGEGVAERSQAWAELARVEARRAGKSI
jgi:hypothetical protein